MTRDKNLADKLKYIFKIHKKRVVAEAFGFKSPSSLTTWDNSKEPTITKLHLLGLQEYFQIPLAVFDDDIPFNEITIKKQISDYKTFLKIQEKEKMIFEILRKEELLPSELFDEDITKEKEISKIIKKYKSNRESNSQVLTSEKLFPQDPRVWENLKGEFYAYMYGSHIFNENREIKCIKTTFYDDFQVIDQHENRGVVMLGDYQGIIIKKTPNEGHFSIIVFPTKQVTYGTFRFNIISIQNGTDDEMINWGFYTKEKISIEKAEEILGQKDKVQLKLDIEFAKRIRQNFIIDYSEYD